MNEKSKIYILLILLLLTVRSAYAVTQTQHKIDSLKTLNISETNPEKQIDNCNKIANLFSNENVDSAYLYAGKALESAKKTNYQKGQAEAYYLLSYFDDRTGKVENAIANLQKAIKFYTELNDSSHLVGCYNNLGVLYSYGTDQKTSLEYFIKAMNLAEETKQTFALSEAYANIGSYYEFLKEYGSALKYYTKALEVDLKANNLHNIALSYIDVGRMNLKLQRFESARDSLLKSRGLIAKVNDNYRLTELYIFMAKYFLETGQLDSAKIQIQHAKELDNYDEYSKLTAYILECEGDLLFKLKKYNECIPVYNNAIDRFNEQNTFDELYDIYINKSKAYSELGKHEKAYEILQQAQKINEDLKPNELARLLGEFEHAESLKEEHKKQQLEQELLMQKNENEVILIRAKLHRAIYFIVLLVLTTALVIYFYVVKRKHNSILAGNYKIIQEQKEQLEENFIELKKNELKLSQLNATKDKFFSIIAHDLKNPFNVLIGLSDIVISDPEMRHSEEFEQIIDGIFQTAKSGYNLLENLLEWARSQTGDLEYKPELIDINEIFELNITLFAEAIKAKKIEITNSIPVRQKVFADYNMVNFVVRNLLNNAIKFSYPNGKIDLSLNRKNGFLVFTIKDYGIGMSKETLEKLFRIESTSPLPGTSNEKGTGLGLIICKEFIEKSGGEIFAESQEKRGSSFHFSLPGEKLQMKES